MTDPINRRNFLKITATAAGGTVLAAHLAAGTSGAAEDPTSVPGSPTRDVWPTFPPVKIHKVFIGRTGGYMARPTEEKAKLEKYLDELGKKLGGVEFIGGETIPPDGAHEVAAKVAKADGLLVIYLSGHGGDTPVLGKLFDTGLPAVLFFQPFGGHGVVTAAVGKEAPIGVLGARDEPAPGDGEFGCDGKPVVDPGEARLACRGFDLAPGKGGTQRFVRCR